MMRSKGSEFKNTVVRIRIEKHDIAHEGITKDKVPAIRDYSLGGDALRVVQNNNRVS